MNISRLFKWKWYENKSNDKNRKRRRKRWKREYDHRFFTLSNGMRIKTTIVLDYLRENNIALGGVSSKYKIGIKDDGTIRLFDEDHFIWLGRRHAREIEQNYKLSEWMETNKAYVRAYEIAHNINI